MTKIAHLRHTYDAFVLIELYPFLSRSLQHGSQVCIVLLFGAAIYQDVVHNCYNALKSFVSLIYSPLKFILCRNYSKRESLEPVSAVDGVEGGQLG